jgi:tetratricopeptide (TPR) repeat protein
LQLFGPDFVGRTRDAAQRRDLLLKVLREQRMLLIWDNFETVRELPDVTGATPPLDATQQQRMRDFLTELAREDGKSGVIIISRTPEYWLGQVRRHELGGLTAGEAAEMAQDVLRPYPRARMRQQDRAFADLLNWLDGHPLSLRLLLPHLETISAATLLDGLKGSIANLPPGFVGEGRLASLGASLKYSFDHVAPEMRDRLPALALFEGVADEDVLALLSGEKDVPARFAGVAKEAWSAALERLASIGLVTSLGGGMYGLHPALPFYLMAEWRRMAGAGFASEHDAAEGALLAAYSGFGRWLRKQIGEGSAEAAFSLIERQRRTMGRMLGFALSQRRYREAQALMDPLNELWQARGLGPEARGWVDRCRNALEADDGAPPDLDGEAGALWLFVVSAEANRAILAGQLDTAHATYDVIRQRVEGSSSESRDQRLATVYQQLGTVARHRSDPAAAEAWYRKSLEIKEALGNRLGLALTHHQLGIVAQSRGDLTAAEAWYRKELEIEEALGNRPHMAATYHQLGMVAQDRGDLAAAEVRYRKSLEITEALGNRLGMASSYHQLGMVAQQRGDLAAAEAWYRKSLEIAEALGNRPGMAIIYHQLGILAQLRGDLAAAEAWYHKSLEIEEALGNRLGVAGSYHQLGLLAQHRGDLAAAEAWYRKCLEIEETLGDRPGLAGSYYQLGMVAQHRGDLAAAEAWYCKSLEIEVALGNRPGMATSYSQLGLLAEAREDAMTALDWMVRCIALFPEFPHPATGPGPHHLVRLTATLGIPALEASWQRCTGKPLPDNIRSAVVAEA